MPRVMTSFEIEELTLDHYTALADRHGVSRSELMRTALQQVQDANPVDADELARARAKRTGKTKLALGPGGKLIARAERPDIQATYDLAQAVSEGRASLAADAPRKGREERREGDSDAVSHPVHHAPGSGSTPRRRPSSRPAVRPDRTPRRILRAV